MVKSRSPVPGLQSVLIFVFTPFVIALWAWQAKRAGSLDRHQDVDRLLRRDARQLIMVAAAWQAAGDEASWLWLLGYFVVITIGELYLSPIGLSLVSRSHRRAWSRC